MTGKRRAATATTWAELGQATVGRRVQFTFPWDEQPTTARHVAVGFHDGYADGQVRTVRHDLDYGGSIGVQPTSMPTTFAVELLE